MQGSVRGKTQWLYADPKQKRDLLLRARHKADELYRLLLDTEAKHQVLALNTLSPPSRPRQASANSLDPNVVGILTAVGTSTNLHRLFLSAQRWMWGADRVYKRLLDNIDMYAPLRRTNIKWVTAEVFPTNAIEALLLDPHVKVSLLMDERLNATGSQIPSPWLYVARKKSSDEKAQLLAEGDPDDRETGRMNTATGSGAGKRATLPADSMLEKRMTNEQQSDFIKNLPYRRCDTDDTGETSFGRHHRRPRRRGTSEQRAAQVGSQRQEGLPIAQDGSVTTASCFVEITPSMGPYERLHTMASTTAFVIHSLYFDGRAVSVRTSSNEIATILETIFGEFLDEQFLSVELVDDNAAHIIRTTSGPVRPLASASVWAVPEGKAGSNVAWTVPECKSVLEHAAATDCRSIIIPKDWVGSSVLQQVADQMRSAFEKKQQTTDTKSPEPVLPTFFLSSTPIPELLQETIRVPYLTLLSQDTSVAARIASSTTCQLHESVRVVGINAIACDAPLFFPGALSPLVGAGWRSTTPHEPMLSIGNSHRFEATSRSVVQRSWETQIRGWARALSPSGRYDASNTPLTLSQPPRLQGIVSERLCEAMSADFSVMPSLGLASAKLIGV